jgi:N-acetylmuramoyl-L-alanine amidase
MLRFIAFLCISGLWLAGGAWAAPVAQEIRVGRQEGGITRFVLDLSQKADCSLFFLSNPARMVMDCPTLEGLDSLPKLIPTGLVQAWRSGQFGTGSRIVLDLTGPAKLSSRQLLPSNKVAGGVRVVVDLTVSNATDYAGIVRQTKSHIPTPSTRDKKGLQIGLRPPALPSWKRLVDLPPLVVIDAGHGGVDPGALAVNGQREKDLTLQMARRLEQALKAQGKYRVTLTRRSDVFIPLKDRVRIARQQKADLFISLHADSIRGRDVQGATVYTVSETASDKEAAALAESENRADELAGLDQAGEDDDLASVLIAMNQRATLNSTHVLASKMVRRLQETTRMTQRPHRSAGFAVLKAPDIPSVLIEMGYLSNKQDTRMLWQAEHQQKLAQSIAKGVGDYFSENRPISPVSPIIQKPSTLPSAEEADLIAAGLMKGQ